MSISQFCGLSEQADFVFITKQNICGSSATGIYFDMERICKQGQAV